MRVQIADIQKMKQQGEHIAMITAYDYTSAQLVERAGLPVILVGDTLGQVVLGHPTTLPVTLDDMIHHTRAVVRGTQRTLIIGDMPFLTYSNVEQAVASAGRFLQEGGAQAVKLEGGKPVLPVVRKLVDLGIPVMGHLGFTPQSVHRLGIQVQGKDVDRAANLIDDALALDLAGVFAIVLELIPAELAREITRLVRVPTIGIGAGPWCDGQVQVFHDMLGLFTDFVPRHTRRYATLSETIMAAVQGYASEVRGGQFPTMAQSSTMDEPVLQEALRRCGVPPALGDV
ncbi:MAG: 3-methyl-2-oxobutanoate hydroxymethyltransferase [Chloroflexaceae bacterium]|nr:3-methyl-2-oxobutanoate hydroxymethyltransferase [Chloroflexaceae bacterium]